MILLLMTDAESKRGMGIVLAVVGGANAYILFPVWFVWLGLQLATKSLPDKSSNPVARLTENAVAIESDEGL
jgi:hypothetical protein